MVKRLFTWDTALCIKIFNWNGKRFLDRLMRLFSFFGDGHLYWLFAIVLLIVDFNRAKILIPSLATAFTLEVAIQKITKHKAKRSRPFHNIPEISHLITPPDEFSFPSGHTAGAFIMAVQLSHQFPAWSVPLYLFASLVGFSRIYNGVHYPSDVLAGGFLGVACALISEWIYY